MVEWGSDTVSHDKSSFGNKIGHKNKIRKTRLLHRNPVHFHLTTFLGKIVQF